MTKTKDEILMVALGVKQFSTLGIWNKEQLYYAMDEWAIQQIAQLQQHGVVQGPLIWNPYPSVRPTEYGDYFVYRAKKIHKETWNTSGWAYNENTISHWLEISGPSVGKAGGDASVSDGK